MLYGKSIHTLLFIIPSGTDGEEMTQIVKLGQKFNLYENPYTRAVYTFEGWLDKTNGDKIYSNGQTISTDLAAKGRNDYIVCRMEI